MTTRSSAPDWPVCWPGPTLKSSPRRPTAKTPSNWPRSIKPDVILLDIRMPDGDGLATLEKLPQQVPESHVVMLSTYDNPTYIARAVRLGCQRLRAEGLVARGHHRHDHGAAAEGESPVASGELRRIAGAMKIRQVDRRRRRAAHPARNAGPAPRGLGSEQQGDRPLAGDQRRDGQGARAEHSAQDRRQRPHPGRRLGRPQGLGLASPPQLRNDSIPRRCRPPPAAASCLGFWPQA